ncbi:putative penicillin-binding protein 2 [Candidatus Kuenenia stuttgartiensis]|jgi:penicillin-binding protein 2|uniref:Putative penicillin-binding protein 2 n=1 Tax=Kuenenia stuttgartiensis TaxID=174633 RepID=A0A6G7GKV0_KUEST|nr:penicillin-binding protein 2 [Candidatus Kuenenia stuttgartiensis]MCF6151260.1 penicillin-binding protein 2 [Candidatus Kuenenia stuttgartiensis]QII09982.1 putative penicillin-binding protein 2 [Candidatus Kuenenia stuttgartiensis]TVM01491.1 MAG: penicillin-binding protein 2 [Candidatus Kuenenia stuttgartiensis]
MYFNRNKHILILFLLCIFCIAGRLFYLQIIETSKYKGISKTRRIRSYPLEAVRGTIFDRQGDVLAIDHHAFDISVKYKKLLYSSIVYGNNTVPRVAELKVHKDTDKSCKECHADMEAWMDNLSRVLNTSRDKLLRDSKKAVMKVEKLKKNMEKKFGKPVLIKEENGYYPVVYDVPIEKAIQIEVEKDTFPEVRVTPRSKRVYPKQEIASHVLGYLGKLTGKEWQEYSKKWDNFVLDSGRSADENPLLLYEGYAKDDLIGRAGVEAKYEEELRGMRGKRFEEIICKNTQIEKIVLERPPVPGNDIYLTIDSKIQAHAEKALGKNRGVIIVMEPWTGEVIAMVNNPRFNPNTLNKDFARLNKDSAKPLLDRAIQGALPPGSIFKAITAITAMNENNIHAHTGYECNGYTNYKNIIFRCWQKSGHGLITIEDALPFSCNVFFFETAKRLEKKLLYDGAKKFGIGEETGIDLLFEKAGNLPEIQTTATAMNISIGQGALLTTPLQMVRAYAAIANGGTLVQPHVMLKITNKNGETVKTFTHSKEKKINIRPEILNVIRESLHDVVLRGTAQNKGLEVYKAAGKTGTAETGRPGDNHAWFAGYAPHDKPQYVFLVLVEHTSEHGGAIAVPIAKELLSFLYPELAQSS